MEITAVKPNVVSDQDVLNLDQFKAQRLVEDGKHGISVGELDLAMECFQKSIELFPSASAYTYQAWILGLKSEFATAIDLCMKATELDPSSGNPLNDIGHYLIKMGKHQQAVPWLKKAKEAKNYDTPHFPFINLGRVYVALGEYESALEEFKTALEYSPNNHEIQKVITELKEIQNNA